jgi:hypothetical protein
MCCSMNRRKWLVGILGNDRIPTMNGSLVLQPVSSNTPTFSELSNNNNNSNSNNSNNNNSGNTGNNPTSNNNYYNENNVVPVIEIEWKVPMASFSGLAVSSLQLTNERYKPYKGVRSVADSGKFLIRTTGNRGRRQGFN